MGVNKIFLQFVLITFLVSYVNSYAQSKEKKVVYMGYSEELFNGVDINDAQVTIQLWSDEMVKQFNDMYEVRNVILPNNSEIVRAYNNGKLDIIAMLSYYYFEIENKIDFKPKIVSTEEGGVGYSYSLLVRNDSNINSIADLANKKLILTPNSYSLIADLWLSSLFNKKNIKQKKTFFKEVETAIKPSQAILSVFFKKNDVCLVPNFVLQTMFDMNPQLSKELKAIETSEPLLNALVCLRNDLDETSQKDFLSFIKNLKFSTSGKLLTTLFGVIELKKFDKEIFNNTRKLYLEEKQLFVKWWKEK